jgi:hypothetical protein
MLWGKVKEVRKGLKCLKLKKCLDPYYVNGQPDWNWEYVIAMSKGNS